MSDDPARPSNPFRDRRPPEDLGDVGSLDVANVPGPAEAIGRRTPLPVASDDDSEETAHACLECETTWLGREEWAYCPRCGTDLKQWAVER